MQTAPGEPKILYADATLIEQEVEEPLSMLGTDFVNYILKEMTAPFGSNVLGKDGLTSSQREGDTTYICQIPSRC